MDLWEYKPPLAHTELLTNVAFQAPVEFSEHGDSY